MKQSPVFYSCPPPGGGKRKNKVGLVVGFEFVFRIALHRDDRGVLEHIKCTLGCGRLNTERDTLVFTISQLSDIEKTLIPCLKNFH